MKASTRSKLVVGITLAFSQAALAAVPPGAGAQMQQVRPPPAQERLPPEIRIEPLGADAGAVDGQTKVIVKALQITGQTVFTGAKLLAVTGFQPGS